MLLPILRCGENMQVYPQIGICGYLANFGHQVSWVIWSDGKQQIQPFFLNGVRIYATPEIHYFPTSFLLGKILNKIPTTIKRTRYILKIFKEGNYNLILVTDDVFDSLVAAYIKRRHKVPFVFELSNPLEQMWENYKIELKKPRVLYYVIASVNKFLANRLLREADLILPISKWLKEHLARQGIPETKMMPCPSGVDIQAFRDKDGKGLREKYGLDNLKVIIYVGTLGKTRNLELLIRAFWEVRKEKANSKLLVVGEGSDEDNLKGLAKELGIETDVIFTGQVPQAEVPNFIAVSDIGVSPVPPFYFYKLSSPIKIFEYMAMGKAVVANEEIPEHKEVLEESGGGILVPFTPEAFASAVIQLLDNPEQAAEMGKRGREWVLKNRGYELLARKLEKRLFEVIPA
ncbi:MAG: glycosyltransferase family 4 protein [Dehalococcoidia bacterium]